MAKARPLGALWHRKSQSGMPYMTGTISMGVFGECPVVVFSTTEKRSDQSPDFVIYASTPQRQIGQASDPDDVASVNGDDGLPWSR